MGNYYAKNVTVQGHVHIIRGIGCEDASASYSDEDGQFHIAVVADGHGDPACVRSADGSKLAVKAALECLKEFAQAAVGGQSQEGEQEQKEKKEQKEQQEQEEQKKQKEQKEQRGELSICDKLSIAKYKKTLLKQLTDAIISRWYAFMQAQLDDEPLTEDELEQAGLLPDALEGQKGQTAQAQAHAFGTTLIAALMLPAHLLLIQQGDGRCDVFYEDGEVSQPIPWDASCHENVTTSLCDRDVAQRIRHCVIGLEDRKVIACYLGSDGVEDSYRNMEGTHMFYRELTCELHERGKDGFESYLEDWLLGFSQQGSGDDVSVAWIVDMDCIGDYVPSFQGKIKQYELEEELVRQESRKISMTRKHGVLQKQMEDAKAAYEQKQEQLKKERLELEEREKEHTSMVAKRDDAYKSWEERESQQKEYRKRMRASKANGTGGWHVVRLNGMASVIPINGEEQAESRRLKAAVQRSKQEYLNCDGREKRLQKRLDEQKDRVDSLEQEVEKLGQQSQNAQDEFAAYNLNYKDVQSEIDRIKDELSGWKAVNSSI